MPTLFDLTHRVASELGITFGGTATGGSTTTLIDTALLDLYPSGYFLEGTVWVLHDAGGAGAAPQGEWGLVSQWNDQTTTVTFSNTLTAAIASGDYYKIAPASYTLHMLRDAINRTLDEIGMVEVFDGSSLTGADSQTEYTLPATDILVKRVLIQSDQNDANDNRWRELNGWRVEKTASGSADTLILASQPPTGYKIGIVYSKNHPQVYSASDTIDERVHIPQLVTRAAIKCVERKLFDGDTDPQIKNQLDLLRERYQEMRLETPRPQMRRVRLFTQHLQGMRDSENFTVNNN